MMAKLLAALACLTFPTAHTEEAAAPYLEASLQSELVDSKVGTGMAPL